jgi:hypothetical protein
MLVEEWGEFGYWIWIVFPLSMLLIFGGILFLIVHFWRIARQRDKEKKLASNQKAD